VRWIDDAVERLSNMMCTCSLDEWDHQDGVERELGGVLAGGEE
jgi:hypothetical protein